MQLLSKRSLRKVVASGPVRAPHLVGFGMLRAMHLGTSFIVRCYANFGMGTVSTLSQLCGNVAAVQVSGEAAVPCFLYHRSAFGPGSLCKIEVTEFMRHVKLHVFQRKLRPKESPCLHSQTL